MGNEKEKTDERKGYLYRRYVDGNLERQKRLDQLRVEEEIANQIFALRTAAGLTQKQLAELVGTTPSAISRLEDADYKSHSVTMLRRIAVALQAGFRVKFEQSRTANAMLTHPSSAIITKATIAQGNSQTWSLAIRHAKAKAAVRKIPVQPKQLEEVIDEQLLAA